MSPSRNPCQVGADGQRGGTGESHEEQDFPLLMPTQALVPGKLCSSPLLCS